MGPRVKIANRNPWYDKMGILPTEHFPKFDCVVSSRREFVCDADAESLSLSDIWQHLISFANRLPTVLSW